MKATIVRLEFDFHPDLPNYVVDHEFTDKDQQEFMEDMYDRGIDRDYWTDHEGEWLEARYADKYREEAATRWAEGHN